MVEAAIQPGHPTVLIEEFILSELLQYLGSVALLIVILLAGSVAVYFIGKLRGKK
jgi:hypothetical protein